MLRSFFTAPLSLLLLLTSLLSIGLLNIGLAGIGNGSASAQAAASAGGSPAGESQSEEAAADEAEALEILEEQEAASEETATPYNDEGGSSEPVIATETLCEGNRVGTVRIRGNRRVSDDDVLATLRVRTGSICRDSQVTRDVRALWELGYFDDLRVDAEPASDGRVNLIVRIRERPQIRDIQVEGNSGVETDDIEEKIDLREGSILSRSGVRRQIARIRDLYAEKGYFLARIVPRLESVSEDEVNVIFAVEEGDKVTVRSIRFVGNRNISAEDLRSIMQTGETGFFSFLSSNDSFRQDKFDEDQNRLQAVYYDRGYLQMRVGTPRVELTADRRFIDITVPIQEGPRFRIGRLRVVERDANGMEVEPLGGRRAVRELIRANPGDWFSRSALGVSLQAVTRHYRDQGYARAEVNPEVTTEGDRFLINLDIAITRGPQVRIERIQIRGNTKTRDGVIRREMRIAEGELYSQSRLEESKNYIQALGYFERVEMSESDGSSPDRMIITMEVAERATGTFQVGAGFSSIESFILTAQVQQQNLFGHGQSLALQLQLSGLRQFVQVSFFEPYFFNTDWSFSLEAFKIVRQFQSFNRDSTGGSVGLGHWLLDRRLTLFANYRADYVQIGPRTGGLFASASGQGLYQLPVLPIENLFRQGLTSSVRLSLTWDSRDNRLFPKNGFYFQASTEIADEAIGSAASFARTNVVARWYWEIYNDFVIKMNTNWGLITSRLPPGPPIYERFYLGGIFTVRGFPLNGLGPRVGIPTSVDPNGLPSDTGISVGGNMQLYYNLEFEFPIIQQMQIRGVLFTDGGNAWNTDRYLCQLPRAPVGDPSSDPCRVDLFDIRTSWGFGVRWISPLGPLRFEWGIPFQRRAWESEIDFQFTIGNFF